MNSNARLSSVDKVAAAAAAEPARPGKSSKPPSSRPAPKAGAPPGTSDKEPVRHILDRLTRFFASLKLTVVCLGVGMALVFAGTLAQVDLGLYKAQNEFFRSFFVYWGPKGAGWKIPVFHGGYLDGGVLLI